MKAVILAGGKGTRAKPFTDFFPKAMMPVQERPLIDHIVRYLSSSRLIDEIIIVADFEGLGGQIKHFFENRKDLKKLKFVQDSNRGTAGDLLHISNMIKKDESFFVWFVDNLCAIDVKKMYQFFRKKNSIACIATRNKRKEETGFAKISDGKVIEFKEKPTITLPMAECLGIYILSKDVLKKIQSKREKRDLNLSFDILEDLALGGKVSAFDIGYQQWLDVESPALLERRVKLAKQIVKEMGS